MPYTQRMIPAWAARLWSHLQLCMTSLTTALIISSAIHEAYNFSTLIISSERHIIYSYLFCPWWPGWFPFGVVHDCFNERKLMLFEPLLNSHDSFFHSHVRQLGIMAAMMGRQKANEEVRNLPGNLITSWLKGKRWIFQEVFLPEIGWRIRSQGWVSGKVLRESGIKEFKGQGWRWTRFREWKIMGGGGKGSGVDGEGWRVQGKGSQAWWVKGQRFKVNGVQRVRGEGWKMSEVRRVRDGALRLKNQGWKGSSHQEPGVQKKTKIENRPGINHKREREGSFQIRIHIIIWDWLRQDTNEDQ